MRSSISSVAIIVLSISCGVETERKHISDDVSGDTEVSSIAFHSANGWVSQVPFYVESSAPDQVVEASILAAKTWNDAIGDVKLSFLGIIESDRGDELYSSLDDAMTIVYFEDQWKQSTSKSASTLATTVWENSVGSDEIVKGDIILNSEVYAYQDSTVAASSTEKSIVDTETVMLHEFGHLLGLDHVSRDDDDASVMHATTFIGANIHSRSLSEGDRANIRLIYVE